MAGSPGLRLVGRRGVPEAVPIQIHGTLRLGRKTKNLVKSLKPADIAVINHTNLDRIAAEDLVKTGVAAVINAAESSTGRYPNSGPLLLAQAGVRLIDAPGASVFELLDDGQEATIEGATVFVDGKEILRGRVLGVVELTSQLDEQRARIGEAIEDFASNTVNYMREESDLLAGDLDFPETRTDFRDRHVLIVVRGTTHRHDLKTLRPYIRDVKPILVAVDGGADAIIEMGMKPDIVLGDMDSATDAALGCGAELMVHGYEDGHAPGRDRLVELGLDYTVVPAVGTSQDVAMLLAFERGAALIVSVGAHFNLIEFLDKNREGMSSTFLTRLRIGEVLVDAKGVSRLYNPGVGLGPMTLFMVAFAALLIIVIVTSPALDGLMQLIWLKIRILLGL